jgi:hypothetical protein
MVQTYNHSYTMLAAYARRREAGDRTKNEFTRDLSSLHVRDLFR